MTFLNTVLLFIVGGVIGFLVETVYCYLVTGKIERRSGVVYGPFNPIYAFGAVLLTTMLRPLVGENLFALFTGSGVLGGLFEAACSIFQEKAYGVVSWEYSGQRFSFFGGRTSLTFMFYWGVLGTFYISVIHPLLFGLFNRIPISVKAFMTVPLTLFLLYDLWLSHAAVRRWQRRLNGKPAIRSLDVRLDKRFTNERMRNLFPSMVVADHKKADGQKGIHS